MKEKVVIDRFFDNLEKNKVPESWSEFVWLIYENKLKADIIEDMVIIKDVVFHKQGKIGFVKGINEVKFVAFNRTNEQLWMAALSFFGEQKK